jgi:hypothetical protein
MIYWDFVDNMKEGMRGQIRDHMRMKQGWIGYKFTYNFIVYKRITKERK